MLIDHPYIFFDDIAIKIFCSLFICLVIWSCKSSLLIVHTNSLSDRCFANILSQSVAHLLIFLTLLFFKKYNFIYLFLAMLGLHCCVSFSLISRNGDYSPVVVSRLLTAVTSHSRIRALGHAGFISVAHGLIVAAARL